MTHIARWRRIVNIEDSAHLGSFDLLIPRLIRKKQNFGKTYPESFHNGDSAHEEGVNSREAAFRCLSRK
jgi:hypothetical protein